MSGTSGAALKMSAEEFLKWERAQLDKHEFHNGEAFARAGASPRHNKITYDRGDKFRLYRTCRSFRDYLLVSQRESRIEHFQRIDLGWTLVAEVGQGGTIKLSNGTSFSVDDIYEGAWRFPSDEG